MDWEAVIIELNWNERKCLKEKWKILREEPFILTVVLWKNRNRPITMQTKNLFQNIFAFSIIVITTVVITKINRFSLLLAWQIYWSKKPPKKRHLDPYRRLRIPQNQFLLGFPNKPSDWACLAAMDRTDTFWRDYYFAIRQPRVRQLLYV